MWRSLSAFLSAILSGFTLLSAFLSAQKSKTTQKRALKSKYAFLSAQKRAQTSGFAQNSAQLRSFAQKRAQLSGPLKKALKRGEELLKRGKRAQLSEPLKKVPERNLAKKQEALLRQENRGVHQRTWVTALRGMRMYDAFLAFNHFINKIVQNLTFVQIMMP